MKIKTYSDERGILSVLDFNDLPFVPVRMFYITGTPDNQIRGNHAHKECRQLLIPVKGEIKISLISKDSLVYRNDSNPVLVDKMVWSSQEFKDKDSILLVLTDKPYDKDDYITDFDEYLKLIDEDNIYNDCF